MGNSYDSIFIETVTYAKKAHEALKLIENYINLLPKSSHPYLLSGLVYLQLNNQEGAVKHFREGISDDKIPNVLDSELYYFVAEYFIRNNLYKDAKVALSRILSFDPLNEKAKSKLLELEQRHFVLQSYLDK